MPACECNESQPAGSKCSRSCASASVQSTTCVWCIHQCTSTPKCGAPPQSRAVPLTPIVLAMHAQDGLTKARLSSGVQTLAERDRPGGEMHCGSAWAGRLAEETHGAQATCAATEHACQPGPNLSERAFAAAGPGTLQGSTAMLSAYANASRIEQRLHSSSPGPGRCSRRRWCLGVVAVVSPLLVDRSWHSQACIQLRLHTCIDPAAEAQLRLQTPGSGYR